MKTKRSLGDFWSKNYMSWILYGIGALLISLTQTAPRFFPPIADARPTPLVLFVVCVALFNGARVGAVIGALSGLLWDLYAFHLFGLNALLLLLLGLAVGLLVEWLLRANFLSAMLLSAGAVLYQATFEWLVTHVFTGGDYALMVLLRVYLPNALYTLALAPIMYIAIKRSARFIRRHAKV